MVKRIIFFAFAMVSLSCNQKIDKTNSKAAEFDTNKGVSSVKSGKKINTASPLLETYAAYLNKLDSTEVENCTEAAKKFASVFANHNQSTCDSAFVFFSEFYKRLSKQLDENHQKNAAELDQYYVFGEELTKQKLPEKWMLYVKNLQANGFTITNAEGSTYVEQDFDFVLKWFGRSVSPTMNEYIEQLNRENKQPCMEDASILLTYMDLVDRAIFWEKFVNQHPGFTFIEEAVATKKGYLRMLLDGAGAENTKLIDDETNKLNEFYEQSYNYLATKYPESAANKFIDPYHKLLIKKDNGKAAKLLKQYEKQGIVN